MQKADVIRMAFQRLGVGIGGDQITAEWQAMADRYLAAAMAEMVEVIGFTEVDIPDRAALGLADMIADDLAPSFAMPSPRSRHRAKLAVMAAVNPDDRTDISDAAYF